MNYKEAKALLESARSPQSGKPVANNTRLEPRANGAIALRLHATDILTFRPDGAVVYDSGGWRTITTKERMNAYGPARVWSDRGTWYIGGPGLDGAKVYAEGCRVHHGRIIGAAKDDKTEQKMRSAIGKYSREFIRKLFAGEIAAPSAGDCWYCALREVKTSKPLGEVTRDKSHIAEHIREGYYVPSLLWNAFEAMGASQVMKHNAAVCMRMPGSEGVQIWRGSDNPKDWIHRQMVRTLRRYLLRQLGLAS